MAANLAANLQTEEGPDKPKRLDGNVCSCPSYIVTIYPPKDTEKDIADDEAVRFNIKWGLHGVHRAIGIQGAETILIGMFTLWLQFMG